MQDKLFQYFQGVVGDDAYIDNDELIVSLSSEYGSLTLTCNFKENSFTVEGSVDESQYSALFMVDEEEVTESDLEEWNTSETFSDIVKALERCQEIADAYESESGGCDVFNLKGETIFEEAIDIVKS